MSTDELLEKYPGTKVMTDYQRSRVESTLTKARNDNWKDPSYRKKMKNAAKRNMKALNEDPEIHQKALDRSVLANEERRSNMDPEEYFNERSKAATKGWTNESRRKAHSDMLKKLWDDPEYREKHTERFRNQMLELWSDPDRVANTDMGLNPNNFKSLYINPDGSEIMMRSSWEVLVATELDKYNIDYRYEGLVIPYEYEGRSRSYVTDFLVDDIVLEVKPKRFMCDEVVLTKKDAVLDSGYKFKFITEDELSLSEREFIEYILE